MDRIPSKTSKNLKSSSRQSHLYKNSNNKRDESINDEVATQKDESFPTYNSQNMTPYSKD